MTNSVYTIGLKNGEIHYPSGFDPETYSMFKYGDNKALKKYALVVSNLVEKKLKDSISQPIVLICPSYWSTPLAVSYLAKSIARILRARGFKNCSFVHIKGRNFSFNYHQIPITARKKVIRTALPYTISKRQIEKLKNSIVILVDDIFITGSIVKMNKRLLNSLGVKNISVFTVAKCLPEVKKKYPKTIESIVNEAYVKSPEDLASLTNRPFWRLTTRSMRSLVFHSNFRETKEAIKMMSAKTRNAFTQGIISDGYDKIPECARFAKKVLTYL